MARTPPLVTLPGSEAYGKFIDLIVIEARKRDLKIDTRAGIVEFALNRLGLEWGLSAPQRARPVGWNQHHATEPLTSED